MNKAQSESTIVVRPMVNFIAGVDEVGRGPLVGDVVTAAVILDPNQPIKGLTDSKKLTEKKRELLYDEIIEKSLSYCIARATPEEIDSINILQATLLAMARAVEGLSLTPNFVFIDGNRLPKLSMQAQAIVKGDSLVPEISAASIIAKVTRDREMIELDRAFPEYGFAQHKGYPTKQHLEAIALYGILPEHRKSFGPVAEQIKKRY